MPSGGVRTLSCSKGGRTNWKPQTPVRQPNPRRPRMVSLPRHPGMVIRNSGRSRISRAMEHLGFANRPLISQHACTCGKKCTNQPAGIRNAMSPPVHTASMKRVREPEPSTEAKASPSRRTLRGLDWLNFFLADVQTGVGPFLAIYLAGYGWNEQRVGLALTVGGIAGILTQTPAGALGLLGYFVSNRSIFFFVSVCALPTILTLLLIRPDEIDYARARGAKEGGEDGKPVGAWALLKDRPLLIFLVCAVMFHFANAAMLPLLGEMLAKGQGRNSMMFMSACVVTTQLVITLLASWSGRKAGTWGRKPLLLIAFGVLPVRAVLYTLTHNTGELVAIQILDGVAAGIFGVVSVLVIADLTQGTGRFNLTLGAIGTAVGIGASLSQAIAGSIVHHFGSNAGFLFLAAVAAAAFGLLYFFRSETRDKQFLKPIQGAPTL